MAAKDPRTPVQVVQDARDAYGLVQRALREYMETDGPDRLLGLRNLVIWGRVVTNTLQKLKSVMDRVAVKAWWQPYADEMERDPEFKYIYDYRNQIDHEGLVGPLTNATYISSFSSTDMRFMRTPPPVPHASFFIGDQWGGNGWMVQQPDGTVEKYYVKMPPEWGDRVTNTLHFSAPTTSQGVAPPLRPLEAILPRYVAYLGEIVEDAAQRFAK